MNITQAHIQDSTGSIRVVWFNQPYLINVLKNDMFVSLSGKVNLDKDIYFSNPSYERIANGEWPLAEKNSSAISHKPQAIGHLRHTGRLIPIYPETAGLTSRFLRYIIQPLLPNAKQIQDWLPDAIKRSQRLLDLNAAILQVHFPSSIKNANQARRRMAFEELFLLQLFVLRQKVKRLKDKAQPTPFNEELIRNAVAKLPFKLTISQKKSAWEIFQDLAKDRPMNRLLEGDVGSGKTVVAALAALENAKAGFQTTFMAPTEILARQHFQTLNGLLAGYNLEICLLTGKDAKESLGGRISNIAKKSLLVKIKNGQMRIIVGTHALLQKQVGFKNLTLTIVDEQHRFGVAQRAALQKSVESLPDGLPQNIPHLLSMTATPIPRTLALTFYGDLDLSLLDEMPKGRQKIITNLVPPIKRNAAYEFIRRQIKQGRQAFVVCPRIEVANDRGSDTNSTNENSIRDIFADISDVRAVKKEYEKLSGDIFPELKIALLHGKLKPTEKENIMADFARGRTDIIVSTSVIEVGIDVPNAVIMMIEGAERFGLAQLHQLRGRVGRGAHQSYCLLFTDSPSRQTQERLKIMTTCHNGFELAEKDLALRGPGEFFGTSQSGLPDMPMGSLIDLIMIKQARAEAAKVLQQDPELKNYPLLKEMLKKFQDNIHLE